MIKVINTGYEASLKQQLTYGAVKIGTMKKKLMSNNCASMFFLYERYNYQHLKFGYTKSELTGLAAVPHNT
jgi:hypothetical protein